jgi:hypothetical protein
MFYNFQRSDAKKLTLEENGKLTPISIPFNLLDLEPLPPHPPSPPTRRPKFHLCWYMAEDDNGTRESAGD